MSTTLGKLLNPNDVGYDVIVLAGQSNMSGRGTPIDTARIDVSDGRIWQYGDIGGGAYSKIISLATEPLAQNDVPNGIGPGMPFARLYVRSIPSNRRVLLVPVAHGNTGFSGTEPTWTAATGTYAQNAVAQANAAMVAAGTNARLTAILWVQGEYDSASTQATYAAQLDALIDYFRANITGASSSTPFLVGQMSADWYPANAPQINLAHVDTPYRKTRTGFAPGPGAGYADAVNGATHISAAGQRLNGPSFAAALARARANVTGVAPVAPTAVKATQAGTTLTVTWTAPNGRVTDYTTQYRLTGAGSWTTLTHSRSIDTTATITGLTVGTSYDVQVSTVNEQGTSSPATPVTVRLVQIPNAPTSLTAGTAASTSYPFTWTAPTIDGTHDAATSYLLQYRTTGAGSWTNGPTVTGTAGTITGLSALTSYDFQVLALNAAGTSTASAAVTRTTAALAPLLSAVTATAARAYGLAKLKSTATAACRVRRASDNTEMDVAFTTSGVADTASVLTWAGASSVYVKTWYDQSGNSLDLTQATTTAQAQLINAGTVNTKNGLPVALFDGATSYYTGTTPGMYAAGAASAVLVVTNNGTMAADARLISETGTAAGAFYSLVSSYSADGTRLAEAFRNDASTVFTPSGSSSGSTVFSAGVLHQATTVDTGTTITKLVDGAAPADSPLAYTRSGVLTLTKFTLGALDRTTVGSFAAMAFGVAVTFNSALSTSDQSAAAANLKALWGTP